VRGCGFSMQALCVRCKCFVLEKRENWQQVSALFRWVKWVEMGFFQCNLFVFMGLRQKWGRGGGRAGRVRTGHIPDGLNQSWGAVPVFGFGMDGVGCHL